MDAVAEIARVIAGLILGAAALLTACSVIARSKPARWLWRRNVAQPLTDWHKRTTHEVVDRRIKPIETKVHAIEAELHPNGGLSLRDRVEMVVRQTAGKEES